MLIIKPGSTPRQAYDQIYEPAKAPSKRERIDFQEITQENYEEIICQYSQLIYKWLWKRRVPKQHMRKECEEFWQYLWTVRKSFNRKKGALTTWMGWKFLGFWDDKAKRANSEYKATDPLTGIDDAFHTPYPEGDDDTSNWDSNIAFNKLMKRAGAGRWEQIDAEGQMLINDVLSRLTKEEQKVIKALLDGHKRGKGLHKLGLTPTADSGYRLMPKIEERVVELLKGAASGKASSDLFGKELWDEYARTRKQSFPVKKMSKKKLDTLPTYQP